MKNLDLNAFMQDVHQNAIAHGWWETERTPGTVRSLIHDELSEALEEYRAGRPMIWHGCNNTNAESRCEESACSEYWAGACAIGCMDPKPEGIAVELMDFAIRIFDYLARLDWPLPESMNTEQKLADWAIDEFQDDQDRDVLKLELPDLVDILHDEVSLSSVLKNNSYLITGAGLAMAWVSAHGVDPAQLLMQKHEFNKTRSYKHGGKVC